MFAFAAALRAARVARLLLSRGARAARCASSCASVPSHALLVLGVTGGIASGKSNVCRVLGDLGVASVNGDALGHAAYAPGTPSHAAIVEAFGERVLDAASGEIARRELGAIVFGDEREMRRLTAIVWPEIARLARERFAAAERDGADAVVFEAAVLFEAGFDAMCDRVWTTQVPEHVAVGRLAKRNGLSRDDALRRIASQLSNDERAARAHVVIDTNRPMAETRAAVERAWHAERERARL